MNVRRALRLSGRLAAATAGVAGFVLVSAHAASATEVPDGGKQEVFELAPDTSSHHDVAPDNMSNHDVAPDGMSDHDAAPDGMSDHDAVPDPSSTEGQPPPNGSN